MDAEENVPGSTITLSNPRMRRARAFDPIEIRLAPIKVETLPDDEGVKFVDQLVVANGAPAPAKATAKEKDLSNMEFVLEIVLGNRATNADWMVAMQQFAKGKKGWSQANFDKKLGELKKANRVTGGGAQGEYYSVAKTAAAQAARGNGQPEPADAPSEYNLAPSAPSAPSENHPQQKNPQPHPLEGDEGCEGTFWEPSEPSNNPQKENEGGSSQSRKEENSVAPEPANGEANDVIAEAMEQLKATKAAKV